MPQSSSPQGHHYRTSPLEGFASLWRSRALLWQMARRDVIGRYRGSIIGLAWSFLNPLLMLAVYTFVFAIVFKARWGQDVDESRADFAIILFVGLIMHNLMADCVSRAPTLIISNVNFVKKVVFPLEILPGVTLGAALFQAAVSLVMLVAVQLIRGYGLDWMALYLPLVLLPLVLGTLGFSWFLAGLGVYLRDIGQLTNVFTRVMLFISAVFYPLSALPENLRFWLALNPMALIIEQGRKVLLFGEHPDFDVLAILMVVACLMAWGGFAWFQRVRRGFADVL
ncbi:MAG: ABC transporter permease [Burkholderiaceae bacterium]